MRIDLSYRKVYRKYAKIPPKWHVHHCNGNRADNRFENLIALPESLHSFIHSKYKDRKLPRKQSIENMFFNKDGSLHDRALIIHNMHEEKKSRRLARRLDAKRVRLEDLARKKAWEAVRASRPGVVIRKANK